MAIVKCHPIKGDIQNAINYIINPDKCAEGCIGSENTNIYTAGLEWKIKREKGIRVKKESPYDQVMGFHFIQSFPVGSITCEEAFDLSKEWIDSILNGKYDYVITTHKDKAHVHCHIIVNADNNITGKKMDVFFKRDLPMFKRKSDETCIRHNKEVLEECEKKYEYTYYEWLKKNKGDSYKEIVRKAIDEIIPRVKNFNEFKLFLEAQGFEIDVGDGKPVVEHGHVSTTSYRFSVNEKMLYPEKETEFYYYIRIPCSQNYLYVPKEKCNWTTNKKTLFIELSSDLEYECYYSVNQTFHKINLDTLKNHFENKSKEIKNRKGLRIKPPHATKFIRCNRINKNEFDEGYSLEEVIDRIDKNGRYISDPDIEEIIKKDFTLQEKEVNKTKFFESIGVKEDYYTSKFNQMTSFEKMVYFKMQNINEMLREIRNINIKKADNSSLQSLYEQRTEIIKQLKEYGDLAKKKEKGYVELLNCEAENLIAVTKEEKEDYINTYIKPLRVGRIALKNELDKVQESIKEKESDKSISR